MGSQTFKNRSNFQEEVSGDQQPMHQQQQQESTDDGENTKRVNTDEFVETLTDKPPNYEKDTQTDFKIDVPIVRQYMDPKRGIDTETQIWDTDLFDFDYEVEPILSALLGKTIDLSRMEVRQEQELLKMKQEQEKYQQLKNQELAEIKRLELKEKKLWEENMNRKDQFERKLEQRIVGHKHFCARQIAKKFVNQIPSRCINSLNEQGLFTDPLYAKIVQDVLPWFHNIVQSNCERRLGICELSNSLCKNVNEKNINLHQSALDKMARKREKERLEHIKQEQERQERRQKRHIEKLRRLEEIRRKRIREEIDAKLLQKAEARMDVLTQTLADLDGSEKEQHFVGLFGGIIGEVSLLLKSLIEIGSSDQFDGSDELFTLEELTKFLPQIFDTITGSAVAEIGVTSKAETAIQEIVPELTLDAVSTAEQEFLPKIQEVLERSIVSYALKVLKLNEEKYQLTELIQLVGKKVVEFALTSEEGKNIKFTKIEESEAIGQIGLMKFCPPLNQLQVRVIQQKPKPGQKGKPTQQQQQQQQAKLNESKSEEEEPQVQFLAEADLEDKATLVPPIGEDIKVFVYHPVGQIMVRQEVLNMLSAQSKKLQGMEYDILKAVSQSIDEIVEEVLGEIDKTVPIFLYDDY
eukprot:TRINITY_DN1529_c0_g1_i3.p1 TRINITY_DN1529_c0_g1~~TRINITY_DN1529_c0_g1_i3.p1  ORF type:complete len:636 (+),score=86.79 TRINITY_DN1529_c0_g1_i3:151-2058(+)